MIFVSTSGILGLYTILSRSERKGIHHMRRVHPLSALLLLASLLLFAGGCGTAAPSASASDSPARDGMKAVWVATVYHLDYPSAATTDSSALKREADEILNECASLGMNTVILQVRPSADALYPSSLFPWSRYLTGSQNAAPSDGFDPLAYWIQRAHALGLELHAWINPYRITKNGQEELDALSASSPAKQHPEWVIEYDKNFYFDPALPDVRELVIQGAEELCRNYNIDGIHLDDYFYPGPDFDDSASFAAYGGTLDRGDWRRDNVNQLVQALGERVHAIKPELAYGISPSGVWADSKSLPQGSNTTGGYESYYASYADSRKWVQEGWIDYICPQIYWYIGHKTMDYKTIAEWWASTVRGTGVQLYIGMADYQACAEDPASPWHGTSAIQAQLDLNSSIPEIAGEAHFRYRFLERQAELHALYQSRAGQSGTAAEPAPSPSPAPPSPSPVPGSVRPHLDTEHTSAYIQGSGGQFRPDGPLTRAEAVTLLARLSVDEDGALLYTGAAYTGGFSDVAADQWFSPYVAFAKEAQIASGYPDGAFRPEQALSRAELVKLLCAYFELPSSTEPPDFPDVPDGYWAAGPLSYAAEQGWISGYPDGTLQPERAVSRAEAVKIINTALGRTADPATAVQTPSPFSDVSVQHWAYPQILAAAGALY